MNAYICVFKTLYIYVEVYKTGVDDIVTIDLQYLRITVLFTIKGSSSSIDANHSTKIISEFNLFLEFIFIYSVAVNIPWKLKFTFGLLGDGF